jgi:hypothetical protein
VSAAARWPRKGIRGRSKLPAFRYSVKGGMALKRPHTGRKQAESNRAAAVPVVDAVDQRREFLAPVVIGREQVWLMLAGRHQVQQHDADAGLVRGARRQSCS